MTYTLGKHTMKAGLDIRHVRYADIETFAPEYASDDFGDFIFQPTFTGNAFGDFLEGAPTTLNFAVSSPDVQGTANQYSFFAQDEYQVNSRLTLSYGLRWQMLPGFQEMGGNLANFDQRNNSIVVPDALAGYLASQNIESSNLAFQQSFNACNLNMNLTGTQNAACTKYVTASQDGLPQNLRNTYKGNFQPRFAFAYRPFNDTRTVIRGGFGIFTMTNLGPLSITNSGNPTSALHSYANYNTAGANTPLIMFPNTAPPSTSAQIGGGSLDQGVDPNFRDPQTNQWNLTLERQITNDTSVRASYVGMHSYRLSITEDLNQIPASTTPFTTTAASPYVDPRSPYQNWTELYSTFNAGEQNYHAFELQATHRMAHGLQYDANYTLAYNRADNQGDVPTAFAGEVNYGVPIANRFNIRKRSRQRRRHAPSPHAVDRHVSASLRPGPRVHDQRQHQESPPRRLGSHDRDPAGDRSLADADPQRLARSVQHQHGQPRRVRASRSGLEPLLHRPVAAGVLQHQRLRAHPGRRRSLRQCRCRHPAGTGNRHRQLGRREGLPHHGTGPCPLRDDLHQRAEPHQLRAAGNGHRPEHLRPADRSDDRGERGQPYRTGSAAGGVLTLNPGRRIPYKAMQRRRELRFSPSSHCGPAVRLPPPPIAALFGGSRISVVDKSPALVHA